MHIFLHPIVMVSHFHGSIYLQYNQQVMIIKILNVLIRLASATFRAHCIFLAPAFNIELNYIWCNTIYCNILFVWPLRFLFLPRSIFYLGKNAPVYWKHDMNTWCIASQKPNIELHIILQFAYFVIHINL